MRSKLKDKNLGTSKMVVEEDISLQQQTKPPDISKLGYYKCVKVPIKHVLKNPEINFSTHKIFIQLFTNSLSTFGKQLFCS